MQRQLVFITVTLSLLISASLAIYAQMEEFKPSPHIFRIQSGQCPQEPKQRVQTGFRVKNQVGIITALHGIVGCQSITAQSGDGSKNFVDLVISKVDIRRDTALLVSNQLAHLNAEGLDGGSLATAADKLMVVGYPLGLVDQQEADVSIKYAKAPLRTLIKPQVRTYLSKRASPAVDILAYRVQGPLVPGHSGAPILDRAWHVVAVGNGGLESGYVDMGWAIPWEQIEWKPTSAVYNQLRTLEKISPEYAFTFAVPDDYEPPQNQLLNPETWNDPAVDATFVKIDKGRYEFGSTYAEANKALDTCEKYSDKLCLWEAFEDEIVDPNWRGTDQLPDFWIMETEVTNAQYDTCIKAGGCRQPNRGIRPLGPSDHPVRLSDVKYALDYAHWACGRLPTEMEWEKAARGPNGSMYPWGSEWEQSRANSCGSECLKKPLTNIELTSDDFPETAPVYAFESGRSPYGLYQMAGNVREWVVRDTRRPFSQTDLYMLKGGSFFDFPDVLRSADRLRRPTDNRYPDIITSGFRIVRDNIGVQCH